MKLCIIGAGYVGLVAAACFAETGNQVICIERDQQKIQAISAGKIPIYEPGLHELVLKNTQNGNLKFSNILADGINFAEVVFMCLGTPQDESGQADLSQIENASAQIGKLLSSYKLIISKSTAPIGTYQLIEQTIRKNLSQNCDFEVAANPEFLREGLAVQDFMNPGRIVIGTDSDRAIQIFKDLYKPFTDQGNHLLVSNQSTAELIKYACNGFLATKISFINMLAELCESVNADVKQVAGAMGFDSRIGKEFLKAGIGYGGSCLPKDVSAFTKILESKNLSSGFLKEVALTNQRSKQRFLDKIKRVVNPNKNTKLAIWGLAFKPDTDDIREAPSLEIVKALLATGAQLSLYDPQASHNFKALFPENENCQYSSHAFQALEGADALVVLTEWKEFVDCEPQLILKALKSPKVFDARNIFEPALMKQLGFEYYGVGRIS